MPDNSHQWPPFPVGVGNNHTPSAEDKEQAVKFLLTTNIPYDYRAAVDMAERLHREVPSTRPSRARIAWARQAGRVLGVESTVQSLFGYFYHGDAVAVLEAAVAEIAARDNANDDPERQLRRSRRSALPPSPRA